MAINIEIKDNTVWKHEDNESLIIGSIENQTYKSKRNAEKHLHFKFNAWGIDCGLVDELIKIGVDKFLVYDEFFDEKYYTELEIVKKFGIVEDYEHGRQYFLPRVYFSSRLIPKDLEEFVSLHVHSSYSILDSINSLEQLVFTAKRMGMKALALTDHGTLAGTYKFHGLCKRVGIKPILGSEFYITDRIENKERKNNHVVLLAKNSKGYQNLVTLSSLSNIYGFYYRPRIDREWLEKYSEGLIAMSACMAGFPSWMILNDVDELRVKEEMNWWKCIFDDDYYIELMPDKIEVYGKINPILIQYALDMNIKLVATNDVHYLNREDKIVHNVLKGIQQKKTLDEGCGFEGDTYYFMSQPEIAKAFEENQPNIHYSIFLNAIKNTVEVADKIEEYEIVAKNTLPEIKNSKSIQEIVCKKMEEFGWSDEPEYIQRIGYELETIRKLKLENYFLVIANIVDWAKSNGIQVGCGRGSAGASLVCYVLGITEVDPIENKLIFERFLNPFRTSKADVDLDFQHDRRDEVFKYISDNWKTAKISTYITLQAKGAIKDCCRVMGIPYSVAECISNAFPYKVEGIDNAIVTDQIMLKYYKQYPELFKIIRKMENYCIKAKGQHPAGIVVSDKDLIDVVPLRLTEASKGEACTQFDMQDVDAIGLLKIDCLGLKAQTMIKIAQGSIKENMNGLIDYNDSKLLKEFAKGNCSDIFQFQTDLLIDTVKKVKPDNFETLAACTALVRPGAYNFINQFAEGTYEPVLPELKSILKDTRNIILYQEQVMQISVEIAGFDMGKADDLRRAIGKKKIDLMSKLKIEFIDGGIKKGFDKEKLIQLYDIIEKSGSYLFNKAHAVAYTMIGMQNMWFKVYYSMEWALAKLSVNIDDDEKIQRYLQDVKNSKIKILMPNLQESEYGFTKDGKSIRCGLGLIKGVTERTVAEIIKKRPFKSFEDFLDKIDGRQVNKTALENLIKAGAMNCCFADSNKSMYEHIQNRKGKKSKYNSIISEWNYLESAMKEKEVYGFFINKNPINEYSDAIRYEGISPDKGYIKSSGNIKVCGIVSEIKKHIAKNGEMAFINLSGVEDWNIILWKDSWSTYKTKLCLGIAICINGCLMEGEKIAVDVLKGGKILFLEKNKEVKLEFSKKIKEKIKINEVSNEQIKGFEFPIEQTEGETV